MTQVRRQYRIINPVDLTDLANQTNTILAAISDKSDEMDGNRGTPTFYNQIQFADGATVWDDLRIPGLSVRTNASAPDLITFGPSGGLFLYGFNGAGGTLEQVFFAVQLPHTYKEGSTIHPHVHWAPENTTAGNVVWQLEYTWASINNPFFAPTTIKALPEATGGIAWMHKMTSLPIIEGTGKTISSMIVCRLFRDPADTADTYTGDAAFLEFDFHFESDTVGSKTASAK